jgi:hypothetical protein
MLVQVPRAACYGVVCPPWDRRRRAVLCNGGAEQDACCKEAGFSPVACSPATVLYVFAACMWRRRAWLKFIVNMLVRRPDRCRGDIVEECRAITVAAAPTHGITNPAVQVCFVLHAFAPTHLMQQLVVAAPLPAPLGAGTCCSPTDTHLPLTRVVLFTSSSTRAHTCYNPSLSAAPAAPGMR